MAAGLLTWPIPNAFPFGRCPTPTVAPCSKPVQASQQLVLSRTCTGVPSSFWLSPKTAKRTKGSENPPENRPLGSLAPQRVHQSLDDLTVLNRHLVIGLQFQNAIQILEG